MDDLLRDFLLESAENLGRLDNDLLQLEQCPQDAAPLHGIFRTIHTIKGTCGFLGLERLELLTHSAESVLDALRAGRLAVSDALISDVLAAVDRTKGILAALERTQVEPPGGDDDIIDRLDSWLITDEQADVAIDDTSPLDGGALGADDPIGDAASVFPVATADRASVAADVAARAERDAPTPPPAVHESLPSPMPDIVGTADAADAGAEHRSALADSTLRVGVELLDSLMNLVGELALSRNQLTQLAAAHEQSPFVGPVQQLHRVTTDLMDAVLRTRMQPIGNGWTRLPRVVRDLAAASGKQITLSMHGAETELDRQILQAIQDPLTHMIRNSADHGIEPPHERRAAGKTEMGTIHLDARHEGGHVIIEIRDDGRGIDVARVRSKVVERGLARADAVAALSDAQVLRYVFEPGFSTAERVTNVSGRGVGMDVVRSNIEAIGGTVELHSVPGHGCTVRIRIPLTLAIISALLVGAGGETFAVPQIGILELVRVTDEQSHLREMVHGVEFLRLRETLLPLVSLHAQLGLPAEESAESTTIVVCQVGATRFGLEVTEVFDTTEIVVKPTGRLVQHLSAYAGCTITGDGRVIMILDPAGIASMAAMGAGQPEASAAAGAAEPDTHRPTESVLLFDAGLDAPQAVPLAHVARLEEFPASMFEEADGRWLVQYRGRLMPVFAASPSMQLRAADPRPVIVFASGDRTIGLAVDAIRDIVEEHLALEHPAQRAGVRGVCVLDGHATEVVDTEFYLHAAFGGSRDRSARSTPAPAVRRLTPHSTELVAA